VGLVYGIIESSWNINFKKQKFEGKKQRRVTEKDITCSLENQKDRNLLLYKFAHHVQINGIPQFLHGKAQDTTNYNAFYVVLEGNKRLWFYCVFESC